jgi:2,3-dihydroxybiphenyl 1,2-dioxygenase
LAERRADGTLVFRLDDYAYRLAVGPGGSDDVAFVGWEVADESALRALSERLKRNGVSVTDGTGGLAEERCVRRLIFFLDPQGIRHEAFWGPLLQPQIPFTSPRSIGPFVTGRQGLGHVVFRTADIEGQTRFFCDVLGFRLSDLIDVVRPGGSRHFVFMHCSPRHHSLAFATGAPTKKLSHLMLQTTRLDDVGITYDLASALGYPIAATLGRHTNDRMFSFYVNSPSGWDVEFVSDPLTIDDESSWNVRQYDRTSVWGHQRSPRPAPVP